MTDRDDLRMALEEARTAFFSAMEESRANANVPDERRAMFHMAAGMRSLTVVLESLAARIDRLQRAEMPVGYQF